MAIAFRSATEAGTGSAAANLAINTPSGTTTDDVMVMFGVTADGDDGGFDAVSGWTEIIDAAAFVVPTAPSPPGMSVWWRVAGGSEPSTVTITPTFGSTGICGQILTFSGVDTTTPIDVTSTQATGDSTNPNPPAIVPVTDLSQIIIACFSDTNTVLATAIPSGYTDPSGIGSIGGAGGGNGGGMRSAYRTALLTPAASTDPGTFTEASEQWGAVTIALRPAPTGGNYDQTNFQGFDDDDVEGSATTKGIAGADWDQPADENFRIRFLVQEDDDVEDLDMSFQLQYNLNSGGWNDVNGSSSVVRSSASPHYTDGANLTQQIGTGTFIGSQGGFDEVNGIAGNTGMDFTTTINQETEVEYCCQIRSVDTTRTDTIQLRLWNAKSDIALGTYTDTPTLTIPTGRGMQLASAQRLITAASAENPGTFNFQRSLPWGAITMALRVDTTSGGKGLSPTSKFDTITTAGVVTIADGATVDGLTFNSDVILEDLLNLTDVTINGDLAISTAGTYTFTNVTVTGDTINNDAAGNVLINAVTGSSVTTSEPGTGNGLVDIQNPVVFTITGIPGTGVGGGSTAFDSEVRIFVAGTGTELDGSENVSTGSFVYSFTTGGNVDIVINNLGFIYLKLENVALPGSDATLPVVLRPDRNYINPVGSPSPIKSIELLQFSVATTVADQTLNLSKSQVLANCVPFSTMRIGAGTSDFWRHKLSDIVPVVSPAGYTMDRDGPQGAMSRKAYIVEFDIRRVRVQTGTFSLTTSQNVSIPITVTKANTFVVHHWQTTDTTDGYDDNTVRAVIAADGASIDFDVDGSTGTKSGHWWVVEAMESTPLFTVQHVPLAFGATDATKSATISSIDTAKSFVISNWKTSETADSALNGSISVNITSATAVGGFRDNGATPSATLDANVQVITFNASGPQTVQRASHSWVGTDSATTSIVVNEIDTDRSMVIGTCFDGRGDSDSTAADAAVSSFTDMYFTDSTHIEVDRRPTVGVGSVVTYWQTVYWG